MSVRIRTATVLTALTAAALTGVGAASASPLATGGGSSLRAESGNPVEFGSLSDTRSDAGDWPAELTENTRLFVNPYRSYLVQERNGALTLVPSTGWDSCYFMTQHGQQRYPC